MTRFADFTGLQFDEGTSVGAGQVFEFYINFGVIGVVGGFLIYGFMVGQMDMLAKNSLDRGDQKRFLLWFLVGLALLQPGGNLREVIVSAVGSVIAAYGFGRVATRHERARDAAVSTWAMGRGNRLSS